VPTWRLTEGWGRTIMTKNWTVCYRHDLNRPHAINEYIYKRKLHFPDTIWDEAEANIFFYLFINRMRPI